MFAGVLAFILLSSLGLNIHIWRAFDTVYRDKQCLRVYPIGERPWAMNASHDPCGVDILMLGDSRIKYWPLDRIHKDRRVVNAGIAGFSSSQLWLKLMTVPMQITPAVVVLEIGINDLQAIGAIPGQENAIVQSCIRHIKQTVDWFVKADSKVVLLTIIEPSEPELSRRPFWNDRIHDAVGHVNRVLLSLADDDVVVLNANIVLSDNGRLRKEYAKDCLHMNSEGYKALNQLVGPVLCKLMGISL